MIGVSNLPEYDSLPKVEKMLALVFGIMGKYHARELVFDRSLTKPAIRMCYRDPYQTYELVPPPAHLWPDIVRCLRRNTRVVPRRFSSFFRRDAFPTFPESGTLPVRYGDATVRFDILIFRGRAAEHIQIDKVDRLDVSEFSGGFLKRRLYTSPGNMVK